MLKTIALTLLVFAPALVAQGPTTITEGDVSRLSNGRYAVAKPLQTSDWSVFGDQPRYDPDNSTMLDGYQLSTAGQLGITDVWNEVGNNLAVRVALRSDEPILYIGDRFYLNNCTWMIKGRMREFKNRIKPISPHPPDLVEKVPPPASTEPCECVRVVDVPLSPEVERVELITPNPQNYQVVVKVPHFDHCDTERDGWRPDHMVMGMVDQVWCHPGAMLLQTGITYGIVRFIPSTVKASPLVKNGEPVTYNGSPITPGP